MITIALPSRGRLKEGSVDLFSRLGFDLSFTRNTRRLCQNNDDLLTRIALIHPKDAVSLISVGCIDIAVSALDILADCTGNLSNIQMVPLAFGKCQIVFAAAASHWGMTPFDFSNSQVATSYPNLLKRWAQAIDLKINVVDLHGAVEVADALGFSDAIVESYETGKTLQDNGLKMIHSILCSHAVLIGSSKAFGKVEVQELICQITPNALFMKADAIEESYHV